MNRERIERELGILRAGGQIAELIENGRAVVIYRKRTHNRREVRTAVSHRASWSQSLQDMRRLR